MRKEKRIYVKNKKTIGIVLLVLLAVIICTVAGVLLYRHFAGNDDSDGASTLADMMADLTNEPVSSEDEPYESSKDSKAICIKVNKKKNCITVYEKDKDGKFTKPVKTMICSVGYNAPIGTYETSDRYTWKIVNGNVWSQYATRITGNVLFHSVPYGEKRKDSLIPKYYNQLGSNASAGCIRLMVADAKWIMEHCTVGTKVEIYEDDEPGPLGKPNALIVADTEQWDPSDPDPSNPWNGHEALLQGVTDRTIERNIPFDYLEGITATDTVGNDVSKLVQIDTDLDIKKEGAYEVTFTLTDGVGSTATAKATYTVLDSTPPYFSGIKQQVQIAAGGTVSAESLLDKVYVVDNNEILTKDRIQVTIPQVLDGSAMITYSVTDDYGNVATASTYVLVDNEPPVIALYPGTANIIDETQIVDEAFALSRVFATDSGMELPKEKISVTIFNTEWGYTLVYVVTDESGQTATLSDTVSYPVYTLIAQPGATVTEISMDQLMQGVTLTNNAGQQIGGKNIQIDVKDLGNNQYFVTYKFEYTCPLGTKTAQTTRTVTLAQQPTATAAPSESPDATIEPSSSPQPDVDTGEEEE